MKRVGFVILHYLAADVTRRCIDSLLERFSSPDVFVVVVDNASPDGSGAVLKEELSSNPRVSVLLLEKNEGFARGNNAGYRFAVDRFDPDFIVVMNNDVMIEDDRFIDRILEEYSRAPFAVLGPDIWSTADCCHQSPVRLSLMSLAQARRLRTKMSFKHRFFFLLPPASGRVAEDSSYWSECHRDCVLHGACLVFSRDFIAVRENAFNPSTFLYAEEDILSLECIREGLCMVYSPDLKVNHMEDVSTKAAFKSACARRRMKYGRLVESLDVLVSLMESGR